MKRVLLILVILSTIILWGISVLIVVDEKNKEDISVKNITIELGNEISSNIKDYIKGKVKNYNNLILDNKNVKNEVGKYNYSVKIKNKILFKTKTEVLTGTIEVVDTTKPELSLKNVSITVGETIDINSFIEKCSDLSNCQVKYKDEEYINTIINTPGKYDIVIIGYDDYKNEVEATTNLEIKEKQVKKEKKQETVNNNQTIKQQSYEGIAVLNYHFIISEEERSSCSPSSICINENLFEQHIKYISDNGFHTATLKELEDYIDGTIDLPKKTVVITIDDGWFVSRAIPILEKYNAMATLFLIGSLAPVSDYESPNLEIHSHTWNLHNENSCADGRSPLLCYDHDTIVQDLIKSRESLNNTTYFCYPFYEYNNHAINALKDAGFTMAFTGGNYKARRGINKFKVPRFVIYNTTSVSELSRMIN